MSFIGSPFVSRRSGYGSNSSLNRTMSPSRFNSASNYSTYNPSSSYSSSYTPLTYASSYSPGYSPSANYSTSSYKPYSSHGTSARSSYDHASRPGHYDSGLSLRSSSTNSLNDLGCSSNSSYLNRASPSSYPNSSATNNSLYTFRRSSLNSRKRNHTVSPARVNSFSLGTLNNNHYHHSDYSSPTTIAYSDYLPNNAVIRSRPSSTNSYKSKDYPDGNSTDASDRPVNNEHLEKGSGDLCKVKPPAPNVTQVSVNQTKDLDYKKMYEDLLVEFENFKTEVNKKEQDYLREQRKMQRKISELEEELVQMESIKEDNSRLKDENGALVRVISKLSK